MDIRQVILIIVSGLGVFHGLFVAIVLWNYKGALVTANRLLSILMLIMSLRIGKSVIMTFSPHLEILYIYLGLCLLTLAGPLFLLYSKSVIFKSNTLRKVDLLHLLPGFIFMVMAVPFQVFGFQQIPDITVGVLFFLFYGHFLAYLLITKFQIINRTNNEHFLSKKWLDIVFYGLICLWIVYVLNLFEERIPYIIGPVIYSIVVYTITF